MKLPEIVWKVIEKIPSVLSCSSVGRGQSRSRKFWMEGLCLRTSGDFGGTLERVYGERVSGGEGGLERVSTGSLGPGD